MNKFCKAEIEICHFDVKDIITTSGLINGGTGSTAGDPIVFGLSKASGLSDWK